MSTARRLDHATVVDDADEQARLDRAAEVREQVEEQRDFPGQLLPSDFGDEPEPEAEDLPPLRVIAGGAPRGAISIFDGIGYGPTIDDARRDAERRAHEIHARSTHRGELVWLSIDTWSRGDEAGCHGVAAVLVEDSVRILTAQEQREIARERGERRSRAVVLADLKRRFKRDPEDLIVEGLILALEGR